jgi:hypothetical protein
VLGWCWADAGLVLGMRWAVGRCWAGAGLVQDWCWAGAGDGAGDSAGDSGWLRLGDAKVPPL